MRGLARVRASLVRSGLTNSGVLPSEPRPPNRTDPVLVLVCRLLLTFPFACWCPCRLAFVSRIFGSSAVPDAYDEPCAQVETQTITIIVGKFFVGGLLCCSTLSAYAVCSHRPCVSSSAVGHARQCGTSRVRTRRSLLLVASVLTRCTWLLTRGREIN